MKYRNWYPESLFARKEEASKWMDRFVSWYNGIHLQIRIKFVITSNGDNGQDPEILTKRRAT